VNVKLYVLRPLVMNEIGGHVDSRHIVTICHGLLGDAAMELAEQLTEPDAFGRRVGHGVVFCLGARSRHRGLSV